MCKILPMEKEVRSSFGIGHNRKYGSVNPEIYGEKYIHVDD